MHEWLLKNKIVRLDDLAYTLHVGRKNLKYRWAVIINSFEELCENLSSDYPNNNILSGVVEHEQPPLNDYLLIISGQGVFL